MIQNASTQLGLWVAQMFETLVQSGPIRAGAALAIGAFVVYTLVRRSRSGEDPSIRMQSSSDAGSTSILLSGVHVTITAVAFIALITWPLVAQNTVVAVALLGAVLVHYLMEKQEPDA